MLIWSKKRLQLYTSKALVIESSNRLKRWLNSIYRMFHVWGGLVFDLFRHSRVGFTSRVVNEPSSIVPFLLSISISLFLALFLSRLNSHEQGRRTEKGKKWTCFLFSPLPPRTWMSWVTAASDVASPLIQLVHLDKVSCELLGRWFEFSSCVLAGRKI